MSLPEYLQTAIEEYVPKLDGAEWGGIERRLEMAELVVDLAPRVIVEIGVFGGASSIAMAFALRHNNNGGKIYCIDPWRVEYAQEAESTENQKWWAQNIQLSAIHQKAMEAFWAHNLDEWLVVIRAASQHVHQLFPRIDLLMIDGNHSEVASLRDAQLYVPRVTKGGLILADDDDWGIKQGDTVIPSTQRAMAFIEESCDLVRKSGNMRIYKKR